MLILTRRIGEVVYVGDGRVYVLAQKGNQVRLGFDFPKNTVINREEVHLKIQLEAAVSKGQAETCRE